MAANSLVRPSLKQNYALVYLTGDLETAYFETVGEAWAAIDRCVKRQLPYMTFKRKPREGHVGPVWHPQETRFFDARDTVRK